ncbi:MAG: hypothetical protein GXX85_12660 [Ignavibacteria bacterium]|nr:hypothetical protein [Ignavibacteria bacterium]
MKIDDISSAYGPRDYGNDHYDFHPAVDIGNTTAGAEDYPIYQGVVNDFDADKNWVEIRHPDAPEGAILVRYLHINKALGLYIGQPVNSATVIGKIQDNGNQTHLDMRITRYEAFEDFYRTAENPVWWLMNEPSESSRHDDIIYNPKNGNTLQDWNYLPVQIDMFNTDYDNPYRKSYVEFGIKNYGNELDLNQINFVIYAGGLFSSDCYNKSVEVNQERIPPDHELGTVKYFDWFGDFKEYNYKRVNCGDITANDQDNGHMATSVGIYANGLNFTRSSDYKIVKFRVYFGSVKSFV